MATGDQHQPRILSIRGFDTHTPQDLMSKNVCFHCLVKFRSNGEKVQDSNEICSLAFCLDWYFLKNHLFAGIVQKTSPWKSHLFAACFSNNWAQKSHPSAPFPAIKTAPYHRPFWVKQGTHWDKQFGLKLQRFILIAAIHTSKSGHQSRLVETWNPSMQMDPQAPGFLKHQEYYIRNQIFPITQGRLFQLQFVKVLMGSLADPTVEKIKIFGHCIG